MDASWGLVSMLSAAALALAAAGPVTAGAGDRCEGVSAVATTALDRATVASGLTRPVVVTAAPGDNGRVFVVEQPGVVRIKPRGTPPEDHSIFLDITDRVNNSNGERGLLGLAFDPDHATNGYFYVNYTTLANNPSCPGTFNGDTIVSRFETVGGVGIASSETCILSLRQPAGNHNGGQLLFGPDDLLYVFTGDGGGAGDQGNGHDVCGNGQSVETLLGKILRINTSVTDPDPGGPDCGTGSYSVPADNPFVGVAGCDEIWAYGLRNPWRGSIDPATGDLYVADVGQDCWEEIDHVAGGSGTCFGGTNEALPCAGGPDCPGGTCRPGGFNFGWRVMEAGHCFDPADLFNCDPSPVACGAPDDPPECNSPKFVDPVLEMHQSEGVCALIGGHVYRGCRLPAFDGAYFYGDFWSGFVRSFEIAGGLATEHRDWTAELGSGLSGELTSLGLDARGELYVTDWGGLVYAIEPPFEAIEISGPGAADRFSLNAGEWSWEDLSDTSWHPVDAYRIYRSITPAGSAFELEFDCIQAVAGRSWNGDPALPAPGHLLAYLVTAVSAGDVASPGGPQRALSPAACPPGPASAG